MNQPIHSRIGSWQIVCLVAAGTIGIASAAGDDAKPPVVRSAKSGAWSESATWESGKVPAAGAKVLIKPGHAVTYDVLSKEVIRSVHIGGVLTFARDRDTRLDVGLIRIQLGEDTDEEGFDCDSHITGPKPDQPLSALEVGTPDQPINAKDVLLDVVRRPKH